VTPEFLRALRERRSVQAGQIVEYFTDALRSGPVLDYGCGQGLFVGALAARGFEVVGCDVSREVTDGIDPRRFVPLDEPWSIPQGLGLGSVSLLDVLEHSADPARFLRQLRERGARHVLVKVPLATGPLFKIAKAIAHVGHVATIETLFLVGEVAPHALYFTQRGLVRLLERAGFLLASRLSVAEVGADLPSRIRGIPAPPKMTVSILSALGMLMERVSPLWPDTRVFLFDRAPQDPLDSPLGRKGG
jgi:SAM-dependent methyltransferase